MRKFFAIAVLIVSCSASVRESKTLKAGIRMQDFVIAISKYSKSIKPDFKILPQNGAELAFKKLDPDAGFHAPYVDAIDGVGIEELFANDKGTPDSFRLSMIKKLRGSKKILVSEQLKSDSDMEKVLADNAKEELLCFPRTVANEDYHEIPAAVQNENADDITSISQAKNYLYLINAREFKNSYYFLKAIAATNYDVVIIDLFKNKLPYTPDEIASIRKKKNGGKRIVLAYVNIGAAENFRYYWDGNWIIGDPSWIKKRYEGYRNECYVEYWNPEWQRIIYGNDDSYMKKVIDAGFDGAYLDNVEAYYFLYNK